MLRSEKFNRKGQSFEASLYYLYFNQYKFGLHNTNASLRWVQKIQ